MPTLTVPMSAEGPVARLAIQVSVPRQAAMRAAGLVVPAPVFALGLIDTGASCTGIDAQIIQQLGLTPTGTAQLHTPSTGSQSHACNQFDVAIGVSLANQHFHLIGALPVVECQLGPQIQALIGRDVLAEGLLIYDGPAKCFTLAF